MLDNDDWVKPCEMQALELYPQKPLALHLTRDTTADYVDVNDMPCQQYLDLLFAPAPFSKEETFITRSQFLLVI